MKASRVYLKAAEAIDDGRKSFACVAIGYEELGGAWPWENTPMAEAFSALFKPTRARANTAWGSGWSEDWQECNACRVIALLFMHHIAKDSE